MEESQPVVPPSPRPQRTKAAVGAFFWAWSVASQVILLLYVAPRFAAFATEVSFAHAGPLVFLAARRWPLLLAILAAQAAVIALAVRGPRYGSRLFLTGLAALGATAGLVWFFVVTMAIPLGHAARKGA